MSEMKWKLMPAEATQEMVDAGEAKDSPAAPWSGYSTECAPCDVHWDAMLTAAPKPEPGLYAVSDDGTARRMEVDEAVERVARVVLWKAMGFQYTGDRLTDDSNPRGVRATKTARAALAALTNGEER